MEKRNIKAIGSHGQTVWHHSDDGENQFTMQIGDPNIIAEGTGITTVADFRRRDMAVGGVGAPLTPAFHESLFRIAAEDRIVLNLGGIANISVLPKNLEKQIIGFDTGPANTLSDLWAQKHLHKSLDENGDWAASGCVNEGLLKVMLHDTYFDRKIPKSTGREYFNFAWLDKYLLDYNTSIKPVDVQATLVDLTALTVLKGNFCFQFNTNTHNVVTFFQPYRHCTMWFNIRFTVRLRRWSKKSPLNGTHSASCGRI